MEICFIEGDYKDFLAPYISSEQKGDIIDTAGNTVGTHNGIYNYTVGQREGLGLSLGYPCYVISTDASSNTVTVGRNEELFVTKCMVTDMIFSIFEELKSPAEFSVKIRYKAKDVRALVTPKGGGYAKIEFESPVRAVTPGQSAVFYDGDILAGGGIIL
jgi:tRNA-specific 2-thiouridylase